MGFGTMLEMSIANIPTGLGYWLVRNYDHSISILNLGDKQVKITETLVESMLGIPRGSNEIVETLRPRAEDEVVRRWRSQFKNPQGRLCLIEFMKFVKTKRDVGWHFKMNFPVALGTYMGDITGNNTVNQKFLPAVRDINSLGELNWCRYLITVMRRRREKWNESKEYNGSMILLAYAYANSQFNCVVENGKKLMAVKVFVDDDLTVLQDMLEEKRLGKVTIEKSAGKVVKKITNQDKDVGDVDGGKKVAKFTKKELAKMVIRKHTKKSVESGQ
ncbi:uncharacterized protein LOC143590247 [Bidens hawaiensis]|uniref:uncharacterized protein LOC143590247 n=1 Tax=Bidens hawaiensis TaxID=980011 RepID=UPI004049BA11